MKISTKLIRVVTRRVDSSREVLKDVIRWLAKEDIKKAHWCGYTKGYYAGLRK